MSICKCCMGRKDTTNLSKVCKVGVEGFLILENSLHVSHLLTCCKISFVIEGQNTDCLAAFRHLLYPECPSCNARRTSETAGLGHIFFLDKLEVSDP